MAAHSTRWDPGAWVDDILQIGLQLEPWRQLRAIGRFDDRLARTVGQRGTAIGNERLAVIDRRGADPSTDECEAGDIVRPPRDDPCPGQPAFDEKVAQIAIVGGVHDQYEQADSFLLGTRLFP